MPSESESTRHWPGAVVLSGLGLAAALTALSIGRFLFPLGSENHDEQMYVFSARLLGRGHATLPASYAPFRPWASGLRDGKLVLKYTPVWPAVIAVGARLGSIQFARAGIAAVAVVLMGVLGRLVCGRWREGLFAAAILALSPLFLVQTGMFLPYVFEMVLDLGVLLALLGAVRDWPRLGPVPRSVVARLVAAGALWGLACFARPYDALLLGAPVAIAVAVSQRRRLRRTCIAVGWSALGAALPVAALLAYNSVVMGGPLRSPFTITGPDDRLGFGRRGVFPSSTFRFTATEGRLSVQGSLRELPGWTFGGVLIVVLAGFGLWRLRRRGPEVVAIAGVGVSIVIGYAFFWSPYSIIRFWPGVLSMGPFYHLPLLIPLAVFGAAGLGAVFDRGRVPAAIAVALLVAVTAATLAPKIDRNRETTRARRAVERLVQRADLRRAVLFMDDRGEVGFESAAPFLENTPTLDQPVVYALDDGPNDFAVLDRLPGRTVARMRTELRPGDQLLHPTRFVERLRVAQAPSVTMRFRIVNTVGSPRVATTLRVAAVDRVLVLDNASTRGKSYDVEWTLQATALARLSPSTVLLPGASGTVEIGAEFQAGRSSDRFQRRYPYVVSGGVARVLTPGWGRYLFPYGKTTWLNQDVDSTLAELP